MHQTLLGYRSEITATLSRIKTSPKQTTHRCIIKRNPTAAAATDTNIKAKGIAHTILGNTVVVLTCLKVLICALGSTSLLEHSQFILYPI